MDTDEDAPQEAYERGSWEGPGTMSWYQAHVRQLTRETADRVGAMLIAENRRSVNHRYDEEELEQFYTYRALPGYPDPLVILRAIACYEYQTCENPQWPKSEANDSWMRFGVG